MIEVFRGSYFEGINIRNLLENEGVFAFIQNEYLSVLESWTVTAGGCAATILKIKTEDHSRAKKIIEDYIRRINR